MELLTVNKKGLIYLACPYTHVQQHVRQARFHAVNLAAARLMTEGHFVFSPISHSHPIVDICSLPTTWDQWIDFCTLNLRNCYCLLVLRLPGWENSIGVKSEVQIAKDLGLPVGYLDDDYGTNSASNTEIFIS